MDESEKSTSASGSDKEPLTESEEETVGNEPTTDKLRPLGTPKNKMIWKHIELNCNLINVRGGFNRKYEPAPSIPFRMGKQIYQFVQLSKNHPWFLRGIVGIGAKKGEFKSVEVFQDIRARYNLAAGLDINESAVAEVPEKMDDDDDPMAALDAIIVEKPKPKAKAKAAAKPKARSRVQTVKIPKHPKCTGWDQEAPGGLLDIHVYKKSTTEKEEACGNATGLYLRSDHINWLLSYVADELMFQGARRSNAAHEKEDEDECNSEVPGLNLQWDPCTRSWTGTFVSGDHVGTTKHFSSAQLTKWHWKKLKETSGITLKSAKRGSEQVITLWCQAVVDKTVNDFETEWRLAREFETPRKKKPCTRLDRIHVATP